MHTIDQRWGMRQPWISFRAWISDSHLATLLFNDSQYSRPANSPIPFRIGNVRLLYFPFSLPVPGPAFVMQYNKPNAWISFTDSNVAALS